jgi:hypothetical protein
MRAPSVAWAPWALVGLGLAGVAFYVWKKGGIVGAVAGAAGAAAGAAGEVVQSAGEVGIPRTDDAKCGQALAAGEVFKASLYCPAGRFVAAQFGGAERPVDQTILDRWDARAGVGTGGGLAPQWEYTGPGYWSLGVAP